MNVLRAAVRERGGQQGEQLLPVSGPGVVLKGPAQRQVLRLGLLGDPVHVGGEKGEGIGRITFVLGQVEADAAHHVPDRAVLLQVALEAVRVFLGLDRQRGSHVGPDLPQKCRRKGLGALHRGCGLGQVRELVGIRFGDDQGFRVGGVQRSAHPADEKAPQIAPVSQLRGKIAQKLRRPEMQHAVAAVGAEGREDPLGGLGRDRRAVLGRPRPDIDAAAGG